MYKFSLLCFYLDGWCSRKEVKCLILSSLLISFFVEFQLKMIFTKNSLDSLKFSPQLIFSNVSPAPSQTKLAAIVTNILLSLNFPSSMIMINFPHTFSDIYIRTHWYDISHCCCCSEIKGAACTTFSLVSISIFIHSVVHQSSSDIYFLEWQKLLNILFLVINSCGNNNCAEKKY